MRLYQMAGSGRIAVPRGRRCYHTASLKETLGGAAALLRTPQLGAGAALLHTPMLGAGVAKEAVKPELQNLRNKLSNIQLSNPRRKKFISI